METPSSAPPRISVIIATYRADEYLRLAIASVLSQTVGDFEVIVADDGADARTRAAAEGFADPRVVYLERTVRLGPAANHWEAIRQARGEWIAILNHDDLWQPDFLRRMLEGVQDPRVVVAFSDHDVIDRDGLPQADATEKLSARSGRAGLPPGLHLPFPDLAVRCTLPTAQAALFRKSALPLPDLPDEAGPAYDFWLNYLLARTGGGAWYVPERLASWRQHGGAISAAPTRSDWPAGAAACWDRIRADPVFRASHRQAGRQAADLYASAAIACLRGGRRTEGLRHAFRAVKRHPAGRRALGALLLALLPRALQTRVLKA